MIAALVMAQAADIPVFYGWLEHCGRTQDPGCVVQTLNATDLAWVNAAINRGMAPAERDAGDAWEVFPAARAGDCDDYVMSKRAALRALGLPPAAMKIVGGVVTYPDGRIVEHMVLEVTVDGVAWVLDNLVSDEIYQPSMRPYAWRETVRQPVTGVIWETRP